MTQPAPAPNWGDWFGRLFAASDPKAAVGFQPIPNHIRSMTDTRVQAISGLAYLEGELEIQGGPINNGNFEDRCTEVIRQVTTWQPQTAAAPQTPVPPAPTVIPAAPVVTQTPAPAAPAAPAPVVHGPATAPAPQHHAGGQQGRSFLRAVWDKINNPGDKKPSTEHPEAGHGGQQQKSLLQTVWDKINNPKIGG